MTRATSPIESPTAILPKDFGPIRDIEDLERLAAASTSFATEINGCRVAWRRWGSGPVVVLIHGGAGSWRHWARTVPSLMHDHCVLAPDIPGFGESTVPRGPLSFEAFVSSLELSLGSLLTAGERVSLAGFSLGGKIATALARRMQGRVDSLCVVGTSFIEPNLSAPPRLEPVRHIGDESDLLAVQRRNLGRIMIADPSRIDLLSVEMTIWHGRHRTVPRSALIGRNTMTVDLPATDVPVHAVFGARDWVLAGRTAGERAALHALRPNGADLTVLPNGGHWLMYEAPEEFNAWLRTALETERTKARPPGW